MQQQAQPLEARPGDERVKVRIVVREIERYVRVVDMPSWLHETHRRLLASSPPEDAARVAELMVDCFVTNHGDDFTEHTEVESFELVPDDEPEDLVVNPGAAGAQPCTSS